MFSLLLLLAHTQWAACGCLCVDGVPKTMCQSVEEAREQANLCPALKRCPPLDPLDENEAIQTFDAPHEQAHSCREVRIWDDQANAYTTVKVCDVAHS